jgi:hypothetical protein
MVCAEILISKGRSQLLGSSALEAVKIESLSPLLEAVARERLVKT